MQIFAAWKKVKKIPDQNLWHYTDIHKVFKVQSSNKRSFGAQQNERTFPVPYIIKIIYKINYVKN
jgi:hypothetical protein